MIALPWPPRALHPNARPHYHAKASATKAYRMTGHYAALAAGAPAQFSGPVSATINFYPPDRRRRDLDGMLSSVKAGLDGISDAHGLNDYSVNQITITRLDPVKGGRVEVLLK